MSIMQNSFVLLVAIAVLITIVQAHKLVQVAQDDCKAEALHNSCPLEKRLDCPDSPMHVCQNQTFIEEGGVCGLVDMPSLGVTCKTGKWTLAETGIAHQRPRRFWGFVAAAVGAVACVMFCDSSSGSSPPPNQPPTISGCPSNKEVQSSAGKKCAVVTWEQPSARDPEDGTVSVRQVGGAPSGSSFCQGSHKISYEVADSRGLMAYCSFNVSVRVPSCQRLSNPTNGRINCSGEEPNIHGSVCTYGCDVGHILQGQGWFSFLLTLEGQSSVTCNSNGQWSSSAFTCKPISCGSPGCIAGGQLSCPNGQVYNQACFADCNSGYRVPVGSPCNTRCQANGLWTQPFPTCGDDEPPRFPNGCPPDQNLYSGPLGSSVNVSWTEPQVTDNSNQKVSLQSSHQNGGQLAVGVHRITITATDTAGKSGSCSFTVIVKARECPMLSPPANSAMTCTGNFLEGSVCTIQCRDGYRLQKQASLSCLATAQWNTMLPECKVVACEPPQNVTFGRFTCQGKYDFQTICPLECDQGYSVRGPGSIQCLANATWSAPGSCHDAEPPAFHGCPANVEVFGARLGQQTFPTWDPPTVSDNSGQAVRLTSDHKPRDAFPIGVTRVTYTATDVGGNIKLCQFTVTVISLVCQAPDFEAPGRAQSFTLYSCPDNYVYGATCGLSCSHGYPLSGAKTITCEADSSTFPPRAHWTWNGTSPKCVANNCSKLDPPVNGALSCHLGNFGWDCLMSCNEQWDVPAQTDGGFYCTNSDRYWVPSTVPGCVVRVTPVRQRLHSILFYYTGNCSMSLNTLKQNFIIRMKNSTKFKDACVNVPSCVPDNVEVTCGPASSRRKRDVHDASFARERRQTQDIIVKIEFDIIVDTASSNATERFQELETLKRKLYSGLSQDASDGQFNINGLVAGQYSFNYPVLQVDCPPGSKYVQRDSSTAVACAGCGAGHYLPEDFTQCEACPVGSYTELDNATSCTPCPRGWSTPTNGSKNSSDCEELCPAGAMSHDGFMPCQPCPPGSYQMHSGATKCDACPVGTWTNSDRATDPGQCIDADVHLSTTPLTASVDGGWPTLTISMWFNLNNNTSVQIKIACESDNAFLSLIAYAKSSAENALPPQSVGTLFLPVPVDTWASLDVTFDPRNSSVRIYYRNSLFGVVPRKFAQPTKRVNIDVTPVSGRAVLSGLHATSQAESDSALQSPASTCWREASDNIITWSPPPYSLRMPSECDAVDECLQNPCGSHPCENRVNGFLCQCQDGWSGDTCSTPPDPCYRNHCRKGSTCLSGNTNYTCICQPGFGGSLCDLIKVDGGWGGWSTWSDCSATCGGGQQHRQRLCNNPAPQNGGAVCVGSGKETSACGEPNCPVNGNWSAWTKWSDCSASCDGGERTRMRACDNPFPQFGGRHCNGTFEENAVCNTARCPIHGGFGSWSSWTTCSTSCGDGYTARSRLCDSPTPAYGGRPCEGDYNQTARCNNSDCPVCSTLIPSNTTDLDCGKTMSPYLKTCNLTCAPGYVSSIEFPQYRCGEETAFLWNHERGVRGNNTLPVCTLPQIATEAKFNLSVPMNAGCEETVAYTVRKNVKENAAILPCVQANACDLKITTTCGQLPPHNQRHLVVHFEMTVRFHPDVTSTGNPALEEYIRFIKLADDSAVMLAKNITEQICTTVVNGQRITPNLGSVRYNSSLTCPAGFVSTQGVCTDCPAGYKEENRECVPCPLGQYQDQTGSTTCKSCPDGTTWDVLGADSVDKCAYSLQVRKTQTTSEPRTSEKTAGPFTDVGFIAAVTGGVVAAAVVVAVSLIVLILVIRRRQEMAQHQIKQCSLSKRSDSHSKA